MDGHFAFAHPAAFSSAAQHTQHYPSAAPASYPGATYAHTQAWYVPRPSDTSSYASAFGPYSPGGTYHQHRRYHPYLSTESELAHALRPMPHAHAPYPSTSLTTRPASPAPVGFDHVLHEQQGVVPTGSYYDQPQLPPPPVRHAFGAPAPSETGSHALPVQYSARPDRHHALELYQAQFPQPCTPVKAEQSYSDSPAALYGEYSISSPDPPTWSFAASPSAYPGPGFADSPTRSATPAWAHSANSPGTGSSFSSGTSHTWSSLSESSLATALVDVTAASAPTSSSAPTPMPALLPKQEEAEADDAELLSQSAASASPSPPASAPASTPPAPARKRAPKAKASARQTHRPLACHACRVRKIACLEDAAGAKCGPCARRGRECVFPAENGRGKHKVAQKEARLRREAEARRSLLSGA